MSQPTPQEVLEMAKRDIAARRQPPPSKVDPPQRARGWSIAFVSLLSVLLVGLLVFPGPPLDQKLQMVGYGICAQLHSVQLGGLTLPICARNTGIYMGFLTTFLYLLAIGRAQAAKLPPISVTVALMLFVVIMGVDGFNSLFVDLFLPHLYTPRNDLRTFTGIGMGVAIAVMLLLILNLSLRREADLEQRVMKNWWELLGALGINYLLLAALYGNLSFMYWPIAILSAVGIVGVLYCVNLLMTALVLRLEGQIAQFAQLARPATLALIFTVAQLALLASLRIFLETRGMIIQ
jgi:uncharacterized membrane protein